jgi:hypothetical protein
MPIPSRIEVHAARGRALGLLTTNGMLVLQRRGISTNLEAGLPGVHVEVRRTAGPLGGWTITAQAPDRAQKQSQRPSIATAYAQAAAYASKVLGEPVAAAPFIAAYMYDCHPGDPIVGMPERVVSPLHYDASADAVRIVEGGAVVAHFPGGDFNAATVADVPEVLPVHEHVLHALKCGFHSCDRQLGDDHCKRRLAWLAGACWLDASPSPLPCGVLQLDMTLDPVLPPT